MPLKPRKPCTYPGCKALTNGGRCDEHRRKERERYDSERGNSGERGYDWLWQRVRAIKMNQNPMCERCEAMGRDVAAVLVHHIKQIKDGGERLSSDNLMSLCNDCHEEIHKHERFRR